MLMRRCEECLHRLERGAGTAMLASLWMPTTLKKESCGLYGSVATRAPHLHPGLVVQVRDVELLAGRLRQHLVMLLQDLVETLCTPVTDKVRGRTSPQAPCQSSE